LIFNQGEVSSVERVPSPHFRLPLLNSKPDLGVIEVRGEPPSQTSVTLRPSFRSKSAESKERKRYLFQTSKKSSVFDNVIHQINPYISSGWRGLFCQINTYPPDSNQYPVDNVIHSLLDWAKMPKT